mgnify:CR=1 FL=1
MVNYISNEPINMKLIKNKQQEVKGLQELLNQEKSIYIQIKEMLERDILKDIILEEEKVPSTNELAKLYAINPATAAKGVNLLVDEGILYKKRGIGMFVAAGAKEAIKKKKREHFFEDYIKGMLTEAASLGITKEDLIEMITTNKGDRKIIEGRKLGV